MCPHTGWGVGQTDRGKDTQTQRQKREFSGVSLHGDTKPIGWVFHPKSSFNINISCISRTVLYHYCPWEAPTIVTYVLYLVQTVKKKKDDNKQWREKAKVRKVRCKIIFIETMYRKSRKRMNFKFCDAPLLKKLHIKHINVLVMSSYTECPTTLTNCLITFRMKNMPRANSTISMPPTAATPIPWMLLKKEKWPTRWM